MRTVLKSLCISVGLIAASATNAQAEQFDSSFNSTGRVVDSASGYSLFAIAMLEKRNGDIVGVSTVNGFCVGDRPVCPVFRYTTATGTALPSYVATQGGFESIQAASIDSHDRIIVVGSSFNSSTGQDFHIVRYLPDGTPDPGFGSAGSVTVNFWGNLDKANAVTVDADDNIYVAGKATYSPSDWDFGVVKLRGSDGSLDTSFAGTGTKTIAFDITTTGNKWDIANAIAVSADASLITLAGTAVDNAGGVKIALARLKRDGSYDTSFCATSCNYQGSYTSINNGRRVYYFGDSTPHYDDGLGVALLGNNDFFIVGSTGPTDLMTSRAAIARFSADGNGVSEALSEGLGDKAYYRGVQVSDANGQRVFASGDVRAGNNGDNFLVLQGFGSSLNPLVGYGDCVGNTAFCFVGGTGLYDIIAIAGVLNLDRRGRPLFAATFADQSFKSLFVRFTNTTGPKPDLVFRSGFQ